MNIEWNKKTEIIVFLITLLLISSMYIYYNNKSTVGFGDETYYMLASKAIIDNHWIIPMSMKYMYSTGNGYGEPLGKPALAYYIPAIFYRVGLFKYYSTFFSILTLSLIYYIGRKEYNFTVGIMSMILLSSIPFYIAFSIKSYVEMQMLFFIISSTYLIYKSFGSNSRKILLISGIVIGLGFLTKEFVYLIPPIFLVYIVLQRGMNKIQCLKKLVIITIIGLLVASPWLIRNFITFGNPVFPQLLSIFGYKYIDKVGWNIHSNKLSNAIIAPVVSLHLVLGILGMSYAIFKRKNIDVLFSVSFVMLFSLVFILPSNDMRYMFPSLGFLAILSARFINVLYNEMSNYYNKIGKAVVIVFMFIIIISCFNGIYKIGYSEAINRGKPKYMMDAFNWIRYNTPKDSVVYDLWVPDCAYFSNRVCTYQGVYCCSDLWYWWNKSESDAYNLFKKYDIDYVIIENTLFNSPATGIWTYTPFEAGKKLSKWNFSNMVYGNNYITIFQIN